MQLNFNQPNIMGVINVTPDSFSKVGRIQQADSVLSYALQLVDEGADIIDIGAEPTNPLLYPCISLQQELDRLMPVLEKVCKEVPVPISVDTSKPEVMQEAIKAGVKIINDVRGFRREGALEAVAKEDVMLVVMHMSYPEGKPADIDHESFQPDVITVIQQFLMDRINACIAHDIDRSRIVIDPGLGAGSFGKSTQDNLIILNQLDKLKSLDCPILIGASRKTFIGDILGKKAAAPVPAEARLYGSLAAATLAVYNGAAIIRTHDVNETVDAVKIASEMSYAR